jgi:acetyl-CoA carboxylase biotin carboxyl carrier protein
MSHHDGRRFAREMLPIVRETASADGSAKTLLLAPMPGVARGLPALGARIVPGTVICELEVLGRSIRLIAPEAAEGLVVAHPHGPRRARIPMAHGAVLLEVDPNAGAPAHAAERRAAAGAAGASGLVFKTPLGGRYYARPSPGADPFVKVGDEIKAGTTIAIVEVMKTFNRVQLAGLGLPERARVLRIVPKDGDDLSAGDALLELEAI